MKYIFKNAVGCIGQKKNAQGRWVRNERLMVKNSRMTFFNINVDRFQANIIFSSS